jgi:D-alanyl-D-alanine endopeptidase (penicillin-binding protein 7)
MKRLFVVLLAVVALATPLIGKAGSTDALRAVYQTRPDLQAIFDASDWTVRDSKEAEHPDLTDLEDWAEQWGHQEYPLLLADYAPTTAVSIGQSALANVYAVRPDLQKIFRPDSWEIRTEQKARYPFTDLEDWAEQYGYLEYPKRLADYAPALELDDYRRTLAAIYWTRSDLQAIFRPDSWELWDTAKATHGDLADLEGWAEQWGYREYPGLLSTVAPSGALNIADSPSDPLRVDLNGADQTGPTLRAGATFPFSDVTTEALLVVDTASGDILLARNSKMIWPVASITKLMTAMVVLDRQVPLSKVMTLTQEDSVGGAMLRVDRGHRLTVEQLFYATLVASANDAAHCLARSTGLSLNQFIQAMNDKARAIGLNSTNFADPTGLETDNVSNARDTAKLLSYALDNYYLIRKTTSTAEYELVTLDGGRRDLTNTNELLTEEGNGLYVLGGKTGYLNESRWNLAVKAMDWRGKPLIAVGFGGDSRYRLATDMEKALDWSWSHYDWPN